MKLVSIIIAIALVLAGCGGTKSVPLSAKSTNDDTVLWVNADGTDCDVGDLREGDKDCKKPKKAKATPKPTIKPKSYVVEKPKVIKPAKKVTKKSKKRR